MSEQRKCENALVPALRFRGFTDPWEQRRLGEIVGKTYGGGTPSTDNEQYWNGAIPWIQSSNVPEDDYFSLSVQKGISEDAVASTAAQIVPAGSIAVVTHVGVGKLSYLEFPFTTSQDFVSLSDLKAHPVFTCYSLALRLRSDINMVQGSAIKGITKEDLLSKGLGMPSLAEQSRIGALFSKLDSLITLHQRKADKLKTVKQSLLEKMFPREGESIPEIRFEGFTDPWEQRKLSELVERRNCFSDDKGLPRVEYEDIVSGQGALNNDVFNKNDTRGGIAFEPDDVLYGKLRPYLRNWLNPQFRGIALGDFWVLNPIGANSSFLFTLIRTPAFERVANESTGTKMPRADWQNVSSTEFAVPASREEQSRIGALFAKFDSLITLHQRELGILKNLKQACLEKMFI